MRNATHEAAQDLSCLLNMVFVEDCLTGMDRIPDSSIDLILTDLPYGTTQAKWDSIIPFAPLWAQYKRIIKDHGAIVLTACQPFTSALVMSNPAMFRYTWVWEKSKATGYLNSKRRPLIAHEDVVVFSKKTTLYFPQMTDGLPYNKGKAHRPTEVYGSQKSVLIANEHGKRYPRTVQYFKTAESEGKVIHPTQKPVALFEYLVRTYSCEGAVVLDTCIGSGTTAIACIRTGRNFIGFEKTPKIAKDAETRIQIELPGFLLSVPSATKKKKIGAAGKNGGAKCP